MLLFSRQFVTRSCAFVLGGILLLIGVWGATPSAAAQSPCGDTEVVVFGDTLQAIAERCDATVEALRRANPQVDADALDVGRTLVIPTATGEVPATITYTVQPGDWLTQLAERFDTTVADILDLNPEITNPNLIRPGQELILPVGAAGARAESVIIAPDSGPPGTPIAITASGFPANTEVTVSLGEQNADPFSTIRARTDANGILNTEVVLPAAAQLNEQWNITVSVPGQPTVRATAPDFIVTSAPDDEPDVGPDATSAQIEPNEGPPGTPVQLTASGFAPSAALEIGAGPANAEFDVLATAQANVDGALRRTVHAPPIATSGERWVFVVSSTETDREAISNQFFVTGEPEPRNPDVTISPSSGPPGSTIQVTASGFPPNTRVQVGLGEPASEPFLSQSLRTNSNGVLRTQFQVPTEVATDERLVVLAFVPRRDGTRALSDAFAVTGGQDDDGRDLFTRTNIYLIDLEDAGQSGLQIGCGDSVVPVEVQIEPTIAPLTAALERLFDIDERLVGETGLYNALYQSDLAIDSIDITNGVATIRLTGELRVGGVCDEPRVRAQLEETALQFITVDAVSIFVNDQPLAEVL